MVINFTTIHKDQSMGNVMLTCAVNYSYPTALLTWNIMTESSSGYDVIEENSTGNYVLLNNGSLEVYRRFIYEEDHVTVMCLATNKYGSAKSVFSIWDDAQGIAMSFDTYICMHCYAFLQLNILYYM